VASSGLANRPPLLDVPGAAAYLNTSQRFIRRLVEERRVTFIKLGRLVRIDARDLDAFIAAGRTEHSRG
jgi:excisionase family DNA binding protein